MLCTPDVQGDTASDLQKRLHEATDLASANAEKVLIS